MSTPVISVFFAPVAETPDHIALAEELGFETAWVYDSPLLYHDPFITLARAAERTSRIRLGIGLIVPGLRTPVASAAAIRTLTALAPDRVTVAVGAGFTGRFTLGLGPVRLGRVESEANDLRTLLEGGAVVHPEGGKTILPIPVSGAEGAGVPPIYVSCRGERAQALAGRIGDGALTGIFYPGGLGLLKAGVGADIPLCVHAVGSVAEQGESLDSERLTAAVGPVVAVAFHAFAEQPWRLENVEPGLREEAERYIVAVSAEYPEQRYQQLHRGHLVELELSQDRDVVSPQNIARFSFTGTADELRSRAEELRAEGVDELAIQPGGDIPDELRRLATALLER